MNIKLTAMLLVSLLFFAVSLKVFPSLTALAEDTPDVYVGVDMAHAGNAIALIDEVSSYTNLFIFGAGANDQLCQYAYDKGLSFINYGNFIPEKEWLVNAKSKWGNRLLGFYYNDEIGGRQLDTSVGGGIFNVDYFKGEKPTSYIDAANKFIEIYTMMLNKENFGLTGSTYYPLFTSDYALYWFDYKAGYDAILTQFVWNYSRQLNIALCRGAATVQNKEWGIITVWKYNGPPYIESGEELYSDLVLAYDNGAKYITVFDANMEYSQSTLREEHYDALRQFWQYIKDNPRNVRPPEDRVAFVLPKGYAYGFRGPDDKVWGIWQADEFALNMSLSVNRLLEVYGDRLDIIYDDGLTASNTERYSKLIYWDSYSFLPPKISILSPENKTYAVSNVSLTFTSPKTATWIGYSLDNQAEVTVTDNTTLNNLANGLHNITVYAKDEFENMGISETIYFSIDQPEPFPITLAAVASVTSVAIIAVVLLTYFKKRKH